ncbi:aspartyl-phosphate phosphatase Spo0E family protein [Paenibacillus sp. NFR01]|uniref:aspartyl-phosphate phosphatase Spo0E family protein n=1 Tax=Paenibacillus sp. NFR01 TaxID=1566279 RepID=UPI0008ACBEC5|nr:aspartyl-phosphate phosphatase Spo0E family protein [Paenibacillus sp. NFR01]SEU23759.1 Spo0E like sporulation regulatory protein [Paenibacillus sp. NFR01]
MPNNTGVTLLRVERARQKLYQAQKRYGFFTHPKVVKQSVILDELLNEYNGAAQASVQSSVTAQCL